MNKEYKFRIYVEKKMNVKAWPVVSVKADSEEQATTVLASLMKEDVLQGEHLFMEQAYRGKAYECPDYEVSYSLGSATLLTEDEGEDDKVIVIDLILASAGRILDDEENDCDDLKNLLDM